MNIKISLSNGGQKLETITVNACIGKYTSMYTYTQNMLIKLQLVG